MPTNAPTSDRPKLGEITKRQAFTTGTALNPADVLPASYETYRQIRKHPTVALARALAIAPVVASQWSVEADKDVDQEVVQFVREQFLPLRQLVLDAAMRADVDFGHQGWEKVFALDGRRRIRLAKLKPLLQDITDILVDEATGAFAGFRQGKVRVPLSNALLIPFRVEGTNWIGEPRLENVREAWTWWMDANAGAAKYDRKVAGAHLKIGYPPGKSTDQYGRERPNDEIAQEIAARFQSSGAVCVQRDMAAFVDRFDVDSPGWLIEIMGDGGGLQPTFVERLRYLDSLACRGILVPERTATEGQMGTLAEAEAHADIGLTLAELAHQYIVLHLNWHAVDQVLALNWGEETRGKVRILASPIRDENRQFLREVYKSFLQNPQGFLEEFGKIDTDALKDDLAVPRVDESEEPSAGPFDGVPLPGVDPDDPAAAAVRRIYAALEEGAQPENQAPPIADQVQAAAQGEVQATALNGAQIAAVVDICSQVTEGRITPRAAKVLIGLSFPLIDPERIARLVDALEVKGEAEPAAEDAFGRPQDADGTGASGQVSTRVDPGARESTEA